MEIPVAIHKDPHSVYGVTIPDVPGCFSWGNTVQEALRNSKEAIQTHIESILLDSNPVDITPSTIDELTKRPEFHGAIWALVELDPARLDPKPERINISIPRFALNKIDRFAEARHESRSGFLTRAALSVIALESNGN
jgi:predicted RNase H-like HicB family nuclease